MARNVTWTVEGDVAEVRLDRPDKLNALTLDMLADLGRAARELRRDRSLRAVVLSGSGDSFCAGLDFAAVLKQPPRILTTFLPNPLRGTNGFQEACWAWRRLPVPVIAVVRGHCFGGGLQIALGADFRFTTPDSEWSVLEGRWGLIPDMSGIRSLSEQVGMDVAKRLTMTAEIIDGERAAGIGLATSVSGDPRAEADALIEQLRGRSPDAVAAAKRLFDETWTASARQTFSRERVEQFALLVARNTAVARNAAFQRETPVFRPRARR